MDEKDKLKEGWGQQLFFADIVDEQNVDSDEAIAQEPDNSIPVEELAESAVKDTYKEKMLESMSHNAAAVAAINEGGFTTVSDAAAAYEWATENLDYDGQLNQFKKQFSDKVHKLARGENLGGSGSSKEPAAPARNTSTIEDIEASDVSEEFKMLASRISQASAENGGSIAEVVKRKFDKIEAETRQILRGRSAKKFLLVCGDAGIGKTFSVKSVVKKFLNKEVVDFRPAASPGSYSYNRGQVGSSPSAVAAFFYVHRNDNLIILDDCDGVLEATKRSQDIANIMKALLDSDPVVTPNGRIGNRASFAPAVINLANKIIGGAQEEEGDLDDPLFEKTGVWISIDKDRLLNEGVFDMGFGARHFEEKVDDSVREFWCGKETVRRFDEAANASRNIPNKTASLLRKFKEADAFIDEPDDGQGIKNGGFWFTAPIIFISNMKREDIAEAVTSRCNVSQICLTSKEFLCRAEQILDKMQLAKGSTFSAEEIEFGKRQVHGALKLAIEAADKNMSIVPGEPAPRIAIQLQFRLYNDLFGTYEFEVDKWLDEHGNPMEALKEQIAKFEKTNPKLADKLKSISSPQEAVAWFIQPDFLRYDVIPYLENRPL